MRIRVCMSLPSEERSVPLARHTLSTALHDAGVAREAIEAMEVALTEACTNVVVNAGASDSYDVTFEVDDAWLTADVVDSGRGLAQWLGPRPGSAEVDPATETGHQMPLIRAFADLIALDSIEGGGATMRLIVRLPEGDRDDASTPLSPAVARHDLRRRMVEAVERSIDDRSLRTDEPRRAEERERLADVRERLAAERFARLRHVLMLAEDEAKATRLRSKQHRVELSRRRRQAAHKRDAAAEERHRIAELRNGETPSDDHGREADREDREADRRDREADRRDREADWLDYQADVLEDNEEALLREVALFEIEEAFELLMERADLRDLRAEQREHRARRERRPGKAAADQGERALADDRDVAAEERAEFRVLFERLLRARWRPRSADESEDYEDDET